MSSQEKLWWRIHLRSNDSYTMSMLVVELGASGAEILSDQDFLAFFQGTEDGILAFQESISSYQIEFLGYEQFENENWIQNCKEIWTPITVGNLTIRPVIEPESFVPETVAANQLYIVPGNGFGTGHHESTRQALTLLQSKNLPVNTINSAIDVGTGNGILALAFSALYSGTVEALDNDSEAIENARENLTLNPTISQNVKLSCDILNQGYGHCDLILANIYAEVLASLESDFGGHLNQGGYLIMSGITEHSIDMLLERFSEPNWSLIEQLNENGWVGLLMRKAQ